MAYQSEISRSSPTALVFLVDQSWSMSESWGEGKSKSDEVAIILNRLLYNLIMKCTKNDGVRNYFNIGVIGYGSSVKPVLKGDTLAGRDLIPINEIADNPLRVDRVMKKESDGAGGLIEAPMSLPVWIEPEADNSTPMCRALDYAYTILKRWVDDNPDSFPPIVFNITDGDANDGDPEENAEKIKMLKTNDGNALLFNVHASSDTKHIVKYPDDLSLLNNDPYAIGLFNMSSVMPESFTATLSRSEEKRYSNTSRGYILNCDAANLIHFLDIGTRTDHRVHNDQEEEE